MHKPLKMNINMLLQLIIDEKILSFTPLYGPITPQPLFLHHKVIFPQDNLLFVDSLAGMFAYSCLSTVILNLTWIKKNKNKNAFMPFCQRVA